MFTVRMKLALLVGLPLVLVGLAVPVLSASQHEELTDSANDQVEDAQRAFEAELEDDLTHLHVTARSVARSDKAIEAVRNGQLAKAMEVVHVFSELYPRLDIVLADSTGAVLGDVGPTKTTRNLHEIAELGDFTHLTERFVLLAQGCASVEAHAPPALAVLYAIGGVGWVLVCEPLDEGYLENVSDKLHVELAFVSTDGARLSATTHFPRISTEVGGMGTSIAELGPQTFAVHRFHVDKLAQDGHSRAQVVAAVDVSKTTQSVHRHLYRLFGVLALITAIAVAVGVRIATVMSLGLSQVVAAYRKLAQNQYIHVPTLRTKDEIELLATGFNQMVDGLVERDKLRTTFGKYMTESVLEHLLSGKVALGGKTIKVTILFSDIRSFTSISEKMEAHALVQLLNEYFTEMVRLVMSNGGVVDKYIGDAIMAVFGAPVPTEQDAANAVRAAVEMRQALRRLNERLVARGAEPLRTGIGIHTGEVVAGNIGSEQRMEYTVIGDPVNVASRLESNTKELGVDVLISDATFEETKDIIECRPVAALNVKGRAEPVMTYELLGITSRDDGDATQ